MKTAEAGRKEERGAIEILQSNYTDKGVRLDWSQREERKRKENADWGTITGQDLTEKSWAPGFKVLSPRGVALINSLSSTFIAEDAANAALDPLPPFTALSLDAAAPPPLHQSPAYNLLQNVPARSGENPSTHTKNTLEGLENSIWLDNQLDYSFPGERREPF